MNPFYFFVCFYPKINKNERKGVDFVMETIFLWDKQREEEHRVTG